MNSPFLTDTDKAVVHFAPPRQPSPSTTYPDKAYWLNRKPVGLADLTPAWFLSAMTPRYQPDDGSTLRTLTPPRRSAGLPVWVALLAVCVLAAGAFAWGLYR